MNDRFKFRIWYEPSYQEPEMIYEAEQTYDNRCENKGSFYHYNFGEILNDKHCTIMQCTGLKDKNGKLIYEGDIVKITKADWRKDLYSLIYLVCWDRTQWQLGLLKWQRPKAQRNRRIDRQFPFKDIVSFDDYTPNKFFAQCEVIGNYYENKKLLEDNQ